MEGYYGRATFFARSKQKVSKSEEAKMLYFNAFCNTKWYILICCPVVSHLGESGPKSPLRGACGVVFACQIRCRNPFLPSPETPILLRVEVAVDAN